MSLFYNGTPDEIVVSPPTSLNTWRFKPKGVISLTYATPVSPKVPESLRSTALSFVSAPRISGIEGLPEYDEEIILLMSIPVGEFLAAHPEMWKGPVMGIDTSPAGAIRNFNGDITGTRNLVVYKSSS